MAPTKIFVGSLPEGSTNDDIRALFETHGKVEECDVVKDYAFVHMANEGDAREAIEALNGHEYKGVAITVEESRSKVRSKPGMGGRTQCFRCGKSGHWSKECRSGGRGYGPRGYGPPPGRGFGRPSPYDRRPPYEDHYDRRGPYERYDYREADYYARRSPPREYYPPSNGYGRDPYERPHYDDRGYGSRYAPPPRSSPYY